MAIYFSRRFRDFRMDESIKAFFDVALIIYGPSLEPSLEPTKHDISEDMTFLFVSPPARGTALCISMFTSTEMSPRMAAMVRSGKGGGNLQWADQICELWGCKSNLTQNRSVGVLCGVASVRHAWPLR